MSTENHNGAIRVRLFDTATDRLPPSSITSDIDPKRDTILLATHGADVLGFLAVRLVPLVHDLVILPSPIQRRIADLLFSYAEGYVRASGRIDALCLVEPGNEPMRRWLSEHGATEEEPATVYTLEVQ